MAPDEIEEGRPFHIRCKFQYENLKNKFPDLEVRTVLQCTSKDTSFKKPKPPSRQPKGKQPKVIEVEDILHDKNYIDTGGYVDETMVFFLPEFCERVGIKKMPRDPSELCMKFNLLIPDCGALQEL